ncbi:hypothetical protein [Caldimonas brevitalea]|uniref:HEAT repeat domain-containing protein n=1 Tax=Caldimonas brevitalea TaxID=413882 RepID=A0A0G3BP72_9BURK|nr:hypothetical protein [Caldimonas brevitalea]AKJ28340.1 hypothetical protein AAW51_1649 [Caldimonas brevitalea]
MAFALKPALRWPLFALSVAAAAALGWHVLSDETGPQSPGASPPGSAGWAVSPSPAAEATPGLRPTAGTAPTASAGEAAFEQTLEAYRRQRGKPEDHEGKDAVALDELEASLARDPALRGVLMRRLQASADPIEKRLIKTLLSSLPAAEQLAFSQQLLGSADAVQRRDGFELMLQIPGSQARDQQLAQALGREQDREVVLSVVSTLMKPEDTPATDALALVQQLQVLAGHADTAVRSASLQALALWDPSAQTDATLRLALRDPDEDIRIAAADSIAGNRRRVDAMKADLTAVAGNTSESAVTRRAALLAMQNTRLGEAESSAFAQLMLELQAQEPPDSSAPSGSDASGDGDSNGDDEEPSDSGASPGDEPPWGSDEP